MPVALSSASAAMHGALVPIATGTITTANNGITFNNIPQGYQDLRIVCQWKSLVTSVNQDGFWIGSSNVTLGNFSTTYLKGDGSSASSSRTGGYYGAYLGDIAGSSSGVNASTFATVTIDILNYRNTSTYKTVFSRIACDLNGAGQTWLSVALLQTTSALSSVNVFNYNAGTNAVTGSTATLYGVRSVGQ
jgi:hypothetical protein